MANYVLRTSDGTHIAVMEDESADIDITLTDTGGETIQAGLVSSITGSLMLSDGTIINSRSDQDVLDANDGTLSGGVLKMKLGPLDNIVVDSTLTAGQFETHLFQVKYVWTDGGGKERTGIETFEFTVEKRLEPAA